MMFAFGLLFLFVGTIMVIPAPILGGIMLFALCLWGMAAGPWWIVFTSVLFMIGLVSSIFGD
jgi:hypothetical protein